MKITLKNDFHNSSVTLNAEVLSHVYHTATAYLSANQVKRAKQKLCGINGCTCSGDAGTRGVQQLENGKRLEINIDSIYRAEAKC